MAKVSDWQGFYSIGEMARITLVPVSTLRRWERDGIIAPSIVVEPSDGDPGVRGYSYGDLTIVRMIRAIREDRFDFQTAARALWHLYARFGPPRTWKDVRVYFDGRDVFAEQPDNWPVTEATRVGQATMTDLFGALFERLREAEATGDILVPDQFREYVSIDANVMSGAPVIRGTRAPTSLFAALKAKGHSVERIASAYSMIPQGFIEKAIEYEKFVDEALNQAA